PSTMGCKVMLVFCRPLVGATASTTGGAGAGQVPTLSQRNSPWAEPVRITARISLPSARIYGASDGRVTMVGSIPTKSQVSVPQLARASQTVFPDGLYF